MATRARGLLDDAEGRVTLARFMTESPPDTSIWGCHTLLVTISSPAPPFPLLGVRCIITMTSQENLSESLLKPMVWG